ncbi:hypothetical protein U6B65_12910 [Oscillospiraceae bacterium MB08-C2-2]|nr:hypothetical protein U6B65_12910 [Oscillospiraceae bacterium MB08-C2-2]
MTRSLQLGQMLTLVRAQCGEGVPATDPSRMVMLVSPLLVEANLHNKEYIKGSSPAIKIPVQITNQGLEETVFIRELGLFAKDENNQEVLFAYSWLVGDDSDNVLPPSADPAEADTIHLHDLIVLVTAQEADTIVVSVGAGAYITASEMRAYAAPVLHGHAASDITESTGSTTEQTQRRQDERLSTIELALNTGFSGEEISHYITSEQIDQWRGYDGAGLPEGVWNQVRGRLEY